jgi:rod shape-determining protein MreC
VQVALRETEAENARLRAMLNFQRSEERLTLKPVKVRETGVFGAFDGTLIIDQGWVHGVRKSMCAMTPEGIVGVVAKVEPFMSFVYTLHHPKCRIGAIIQRNRAFGIVHGSGSDFSHICRMEYIEGEEDVRVGDLVVTSGNSVFPKGYVIGSVIAPPQGTGSLLQSVQVQPAANPYRLDEVFLLERSQPEAEELAGPQEATTPAGGHPMPDRRTPQERYAP